MQRVFIAWSHPLFHRAVRLLLDHPQLTIVGDSQNMDTVQFELETLHPDTIIVEVPGNGTSECDGTLHLIQACHWDPRVICVGLQDNTVQIYHRQQHTLDDSQDLLHLILDK